MSQAAIHVFGGTQDARQICQRLEQAGLPYSLSVATATGEAMASSLVGDIQVGRMDAPAMARWLAGRGVRCVIDAAHPYASALRHNIRLACRQLAIPLVRYSRPSELESIRHPLIHVVNSLEEVCRQVHALGPRVLLTTGSKELARYRALLPEKTLLVRVLPTAEVLLQCAELGLGVAQIFAMKGPFSAEMNRALYRFCSCDVVITKESGAEGGYLEKAEPCIELGIPCLVIRRPESCGQSDYGEVVASATDLAAYLTGLGAQEWTS